MKRTLLITCLALCSALVGYTAASVGRTPSVAAVNRVTAGNSRIGLEGSRETQAGTAPAVEHLSRQEINAAVKRLISERKIGTPLIGNPSDAYHFMVAHRAERGEAETHAVMDDLFIVAEGTAEIIVGGELVNPKETTAGEWRAASIKGGRAIPLGTGDVIRIPHGTPHQIIPRGKFTYQVVKVRTGS